MLTSAVRSLSGRSLTTGARRQLLSQISRSSIQRTAPLAQKLAIRGYATEAPKSEGSEPAGPQKEAGGPNYALMGIGAIGIGAAVYLYQKSSASGGKVNYQEVAKEIGEVLDELDYDDGSYGPIFVRLAWHSSGTYDKNAGNGGSAGATIRFKPEIEHGANAGLHVAMERLEKVKQKFPNISYGDLYTLAGVVAISEMGGPKVPWRPGRADRKAEDNPCPPEGRLPTAKEDGNGLRGVFYKMGFNDQEIVALSGAHVLGRCHSTRSGYEGPWSFSPTTFSNEYFRLLLEEKWVKKKWKGPEQYVDAKTGSLMMLPSDMALLSDKKMKPWVEAYAKDENLFFDHFSKVFARLIELGFQYDPAVKTLTF